jgi:DNA-directed RNA polymerase specialized sigma subunit
MNLKNEKAKEVDKLKNTKKETTCFRAHKKLAVCCEKTDCKMWHEIPESQNCVIIHAEEGPRTLQEIGNLFDITRMRVCQIEKSIFKKLLNKPGLKQFC